MRIRLEGDKYAAIRRFGDEGLILTTHGFEQIVKKGLEIEDVIAVAKATDIWIITDEFLSEFIAPPTPEKPPEKDTPEPEKETVEVLRKTDYIFAKEIDSQLKIYEETDVTRKSTCEGTLQNFIDYFNKKYDNLHRILKQREVLSGAVPIKIAKQNSDRKNVQIIGMVTEKRESKKGNKFLEIEDPTGESIVLVSTEDHKMQILYDSILPDEVIGLTGSFSGNMFIAKEIYQPDIPLDHRPRRAEDPVHAAFLSDIHVGSYLFLEKEFKSFIDCLNLKAGDKEVFSKIKYIFVAGDLVDGIGIYPNQDKELSIPDIYKQYDFLAGLLAQIPDYIEIVLAMGNHDAIRNAEPQPRLDEDIGKPLYDLPNVHIVANPVMVSAHKVRTLLYHGTSLDTIIGNIPGCSYSQPDAAMTEYLKRRYLVPTYGNDSISPEKEDYLTIEKIPDILHCGHVHTNGYSTYRGVHIINSGTWQARTKYQEQLGHQPTPARVPVMNLQNHEVQVFRFQDE